jgi:hypothetical protein
MDELLNSIGFKDIVHFKSETNSYPLCLTIAFRDILLKYIDEPIIILEDDVDSFPIYEFTIPLNADALYLGLSICAADSEKYCPYLYSQFETYSTSQVIVKNMLATHAILYISRRYKEAVIHEMKECIKSYDRYISDMAIAKIQKTYNIYANKIPTFYQSRQYNKEAKFDVEGATKIRVMDDLTVKQIE